MESNQIDQETKARRIYLGVSLAVYCGLWLMAFSYFHKSSDEEGCGAALFGAITVPGAASVFSWIILYLLHYEAKESARKDYLFCVLLTFIPIVIAFIAFFT